MRYVESIPDAVVGVAQKFYDDLPQKDYMKIPDMQFGLLNCQNLNCFATRSGSSYYVGMSAMIPVALIEASAHFFASNDFYPDIGDPSENARVKLDGIEAPPFFQISENRFRPLVELEMSDVQAEQFIRSIAAVRGNAHQYHNETGRRLTAQEYLAQYDTLIDLLLPVCTIRREHCLYLANVMTHFFWFHEIAHVTQGHLRSLQSEAGFFLSRLYEFPDRTYPGYGSGSQRLQDPTSMVMEFDADIEAVLMTLGIIMMDIDIESDEFPYVDSYRRIELFVFALVIVFGSITLLDRRRGGHPAGTHPPTNARLINILKYLLNFSSNDTKLVAAIKTGIEKCREEGSYGQTSYLAKVLKMEGAELDAWHEFEGGRRHLENAYDQFSYGNLRILIGGWMREAEILEMMQTP